MAETKSQAGKDAKAQDTSTQAPKPPSHLTVVFLRDERLGKKDYKPLDTAKLPYADAQRLIKKGAADGDQGAVRADQAQRKQQG